MLVKAKTCVSLSRKTLLRTNIPKSMYKPQPNLEKKNRENKLLSSNEVRLVNRQVWLMIIQGFVFEIRSGMNEFDHRSFALLKRQRERPEKIQAFLAAA